MSYVSDDIINIFNIFRLGELHAVQPQAHIIRASFLIHYFYIEIARVHISSLEQEPNNLTSLYASEWYFTVYQLSFIQDVFSKHRNTNSSAKTNVYINRCLQKYLQNVYKCLHQQ